MNKKILIIEDEKTLAEVLKSRLEKEGYDVDLAWDGEEGLEKIEKWKPNLILLDIIMPKKNGYEVLEDLNEKGNRTPVIVISNSGQPVEIEKTKKLGVIDHLIKTEFDPKEVVDKVKKCFKELRERTETEEEKSASKVGESISAPEGLKILLVEDDSFLREILAKKLVKEGYNVLEVIDGEQALKEAEKKHPDIMLLDIILPSINGFEVLNSIRNHPDQKIKSIKIVMLSNLGQEDDVKKAMEMGADSYLVKAHFTIEEIIEKVKKIAEK